MNQRLNITIDIGGVLLMAAAAAIAYFWGAAVVSSGLALAGFAFVLSALLQSFPRYHGSLSYSVLLALAVVAVVLILVGFVDWVTA